MPWCDDWGGSGLLASMRGSPAVGGHGDSLTRGRRPASPRRWPAGILEVATFRVTRGLPGAFLRQKKGPVERDAIRCLVERQFELGLWRFDYRVHVRVGGW